MTDVQSIKALPTRARRGRGVRLLAARLALWATDESTAPAAVIWFAALHAALWTVILTALKAAQDVHMDVAEAFAWGQQFLLGYGKHPPLSGWVAGLWFRVFPVTDWSSYALAMATVSVGLVVCWYIAVRVVDRRRAFLTVVMLAIYPIFNFKGFKYNTDLLQLVTLPLIVLAFLSAFERRSVRAGVWLGLAAVAGVMTKYWAFTVIGAAGLAVLAHPDRMRFIRSPAPWVALVVLIAGLAPHVWWLVQVNFAPFTYAGDVYELGSRTRAAQFALLYVGHNIALLTPVLLAGWGALFWQPLNQPWWRSMIRMSQASTGVDLAQARNVWMIQGIIGLVPPVAAVAFAIYIKTDWGIPLFFLVPLACLAIPHLRVQRIAIGRLVLIWLAMTLVALVVAPLIAQSSVKQTAGIGSTSTPTAQFAQQLTDIWHTRFRSRWAVVAATTEAGQPMVFYSPDHPAPLTPGELWSSGLTSLDEAKRLGFIGICDQGDYRLGICEAWMAKHAANAEQLNISARRFFHGASGPLVRWKVYVVPPAALAQ
ncbi:glycosyltransferase family 39 protein [Bradyrhizobium sp. 2TAF24]|uniref:glycosyltransferase family 39 protein n=1 Tax=Bradyrhizobium sp. 2TAF24 TaxID=3233011 RepID=UPI003F9073D1